MINKNIFSSRKISGVILAGGSNSRFNGITKANIVICGKPIIERILYTIKDVFSEIIIVTNTPEEFTKFSQCKIVADTFLNMGPLGGIHAALKASTGEAGFVFAGDMPLLDKNLIIRLIDSYNIRSYEVLIPEIGNYIEPLHSIYSKSIVMKIEEFFNESNTYAVRKFIKLVNTGYLNLENSENNKMAFANINTPEDIMNIEKKIRLI